MEEKPLAEKLNISKKEWYTSAEKIKYMIRVREEGEGKLTDQQVTRIFEEWVEIAKRINKGGRMINQTAASLNRITDDTSQKRMQALENLYAFLHALFGFYDLYFRITLEPEHHKRLQSSIIQILE